MSMIARTQHSVKPGVQFDSRRPARPAGFGSGLAEPEPRAVRLNSDPAKNGEVNRRIYEWSRENMPFDGDDAAWERFRIARSAEHSRIQDEVFSTRSAPDRDQDDEREPTDADRLENARWEGNQHGYYVIGERRDYGTPFRPERRDSRRLKLRTTSGRAR